MCVWGGVWGCAQPHKINTATRNISRAQIAQSQVTAAGVQGAELRPPRPQAHSRQAGRASGEVLLLGWIVESCVGGREGLEFPRPSNPRSLPQLWCLHAWAGRRPTRWGFLGGRFQHPWVTQLRSPSEASRVAWLSRWRSGSLLKGSHAVSFFWVASLADIVINALEWGLTQGSNSELAKGSRMSLN